MNFCKHIVSHKNRTYYENLLNQYYKKYLNRKPDDQGFFYYLDLLQKGDLNEDTLSLELKNSLEYKLPHLISEYEKETKTHIQKNDKSFFVDPSNNPDFWAHYQLQLWENETFKIFDMFLDSNCSYVDIGAWIGPTALYGCQKASHCHAIEPDPVAFSNLINNVHLNPKLKSQLSLYDQCITNSSGITYLTPKNDLGGDSMSSTIFTKSLKSWKIYSITLEDFFQKNNIIDCNFIKIDIEGGEFTVLPQSKKFLQDKKPTIHLSLHPFLMNNPKESMKDIFEVITSYDYLYDTELNNKSKDWILNKENLDKPFEVVITDTHLN